MCGAVDVGSLQFGVGAVELGHGRGVDHRVDAGHDVLPVGRGEAEARLRHVPVHGADSGPADLTVVGETDDVRAPVAQPWKQGLAHDAGGAGEQDGTSRAGRAHVASMAGCVHVAAALVQSRHRYRGAGPGRDTTYLLEPPDAPHGKCRHSRELLMLKALAAFAVRRRVAVLAAAPLLLALAAFAGSGAAQRLGSGGFHAAQDQSTLAGAFLDRNFDAGPVNFVLLVGAPSGVDQPATVQAGRALTARLAAERGVGRVVSYWSAGRPAALRSTDGRSALITARVLGNEDQVASRVPDLVPGLQRHP